MAANFFVGSFLLILFSLVSTTLGGSYCGPFRLQHCPDVCCSDDSIGCCTYVYYNIGLIVGLCVGGVALVIGIIVAIICCRRRYYAGVIVRNQAAQPSVVVAQSASSSQSGMVATGGYQPGYNPQPYGANPQYPQGYPAASYPQQGPAFCPPQASGGYPQNPGFVPAPPSYNDTNKK